MMKSAQSWWGSAVWDCIIESWIGSAGCDKLLVEEITLRGFTISLEGETALSVKSNVSFFRHLNVGWYEKLPKYYPSVSRVRIKMQLLTKCGCCNSRTLMPSLLTNHMLRARCRDILQLFLQLLWRLHSSSAWALSWEKVAPRAATIPPSSCQAILPWLYG